MRKTTKLLQNRLFSFFVVICCLFLFSNCGLDEYYFLYSPEKQYAVELSSTTAAGYDKTKFYSKYVPKDNLNSSLYSSAFEYSGTDIYYRIYNNLNDANSVYSKISSYNNSSTSGTAAIDYLLNLNYKKLVYFDESTNEEKDGSLTPIGGADPVVYVRLPSYQSEDAYKSVIGLYSVADVSSYSTTNLLKEYIPKRAVKNVNKLIGFDFKSGDSNNLVPKSGDDDVTLSNSTSNVEDGVWYVALYAVSYGTNTLDGQESYSAPTYIGICRIEEADYN